MTPPANGQRSHTSVAAAAPEMAAPLEDSKHGPQQAHVVIDVDAETSGMAVEGETTPPPALADSGEQRGHEIVPVEDISTAAAAAASVSDEDTASDLAVAVDPLEVLITKKIQELRRSQELPCIWRVHPSIRDQESYAYEPKLVSVGPLHHGTGSLLPMEDVKLRYLDDLLRRSTNNKLSEYISVVRTCEARARKQYADEVTPCVDEFVKMLVVDGCFIIEYFAKRILNNKKKDESQSVHPVEENDPLSRVRWGYSHLRRDLMLLENQIPFFVLVELFNKSKIPFVGKRKEPLTLMEIALKFLKVEPSPQPQVDKVLHLLHLHHLCLDPTTPQQPALPDQSRHQTISTHPVTPLPAPEQRPPPHDSQDQSTSAHPATSQTQQPPPPHSSLDQAMSTHSTTPRTEQTPPPRHRWGAQTTGPATEQPPPASRQKPKSEVPRMIPCATELHKAGVNFKKKGRAHSYLDVSFKEGTMEIPFLSVQETTSSMLRNLIALEQCCPQVGSYFTSYAVFMDNIINTAGDVAVLHKYGIMESKLGSDEEVAEMFNTLCKGTHLKYENHNNAPLFKAVNAYYKVPRHAWLASLKRAYLTNPYWTIPSVAAAAILLALTLVQTIFAIIKK